MQEQESSRGNIVLIISGAPIYYRKGAAYERIMNYARALVTKNCKIYLCCPMYEEPQIIKQIEKNIYHAGVRAASRKREANLFKTISYFKYIASLFHNAPKNIAILTFPSDFATDLLIIVYFKCCLEIPVYCEKNELKIGMALNAYAEKVLWKRMIMKTFAPLQLGGAFLYDCMLPFYNGVISISTKMEKLVSKVNRTIRVPILSNTCKFLHDRGQEKNRDIALTVGYFGSISQKKDGILDFLAAIEQIKDNDKSWRINFYGDISPYMADTMRKKYGDFMRSGRINIIPSVGHEQIPSLMSMHDLLILPRPSNLQTEYGFSTKLAEYMASGAPVLVTAVSDNGLYIKDGENGFIVPPGNVEALTNKLREIFCLDRLYMQKIGLKGQETAFAHFAYNNYADSLFNFLIEKK